MTVEQINKILKKGENEQVEFKTTFNKEVIESIVAFANTYFNPGKLYGDLTIEDLKTDKYQSRARNKLIAEAFYLTGDIEKYGSGFQRIRQEVSVYPTMEFNFEEIGNGFYAELSYQEQRTHTEIQNVGKDVGKDARDIYVSMVKNPYVTIPELAASKKLSTRTIEPHIEKLKKDGYIRRTDGRKTGCWEITKKR